MALAGAAAAAVVCANLFAVNLLPGLALLYLLQSRGRPRRELLTASLAALAGALGLLVVLGVANLALGGDFLFFRQSLAFGSMAVGMASNPWIPDEPGWWLRRGYLVWPALMVGAALMAQAHPRRKLWLPAAGAAGLLLWSALLTSLLLVAWQLRPGTPILTMPFYASYLIPSLFIGLGVLSAPALSALSRRSFSVLIAATAACALLGVLVNTCQPIDTGSILIALGVGAVWLLLPAGLLLVTPGAYSDQGVLTTCSARHLPSGSDAQLAVLDGHEAVQDFAPGRRVYFWYDQDEQPLYLGISSMYLYSWNLVGQTFPAIDVPASTAPGTTVALVSERADALDVAARTFAARSRTLELLGQRQIARRSNRYIISLFTIRSMPFDLARGASVDLSTSGDAARVLATGWSVPEAFGSWTSGASAVIELPIQSASGDAELTLDTETYVGALLPDTPELRVQISVNDVRLGTWAFTRSEPAGIRTIVIPATVVSGAATLRVALTIEQPIALAERGVNEDRRQLGVAVRKLSIKTIP